MTAKKNVWLLGADSFGLERLGRTERRHDWHVRPLLRFEDIQRKEGYAVASLLERARRILDEAEEVSGVTGYWDFPVTSMIPLLCEEYELPGPTLTSVLRCEHKYWSRQLQREVVPDMTPDFAWVDPFASDVVEGWRFGYPFWLKPVKAWSSQLGFMVRSAEDFRSALEQIRAGLWRFAEPFEYVLERADLPDEIAEAGGFRCIAERLIGGRQCTLEGFVTGGTTRTYGVYDSLRYEGMSSFSRYQYPSALPEEPRRQMAEAAAKVMEATGYDQGAFNIEFFWDEDEDRVWLLEINPRPSVSHADISLKVDGISNLERMVDLAAGETPYMHTGQGEYRLAAKFMYRHFGDAYVERVPSAEEVAEVEKEIPGTTVQISAEAGGPLSAMLNQDSYSYELAFIHVGGDSERELEAKYQAVKRRLEFGLRRHAA